MKLAAPNVWTAGYCRITLIAKVTPFARKVVASVCFRVKWYACG